MTLSTARRPIVAAALAVLVATFAAGCGSKVDKSDYDKVENGMTQASVEGILGTDKEQPSSGMSTPTMSVGNMSVGGKSVVWKDGDKMITVVFANDKVISKSASGL